MSNGFKESRNVSCQYYDDVFWFLTIVCVLPLTHRAPFQGFFLVIMQCTSSEPSLTHLERVRGDGESIQTIPCTWNRTFNRSPRIFHGPEGASVGGNSTPQLAIGLQLPNDEKW